MGQSQLAPPLIFNVSLRLVFYVSTPGQLGAGRSLCEGVAFGGYDEYVCFFLLVLGDV